jgi:hypothetical protein
LFLVLIVVAGVALVGLSVVLLTAEVSHSGLTCGTVLDHPRWQTGEPCHGAMNRQTALAGAALIQGLGVVVVSGVLILRRRRHHSAGRDVEP